MPFVKGISGNPRGRPPKGSAITAFIRHRAQLPVNPDDRRTAAEALADSLFTAAIGGDVGAARAILDRHDGAVPQAHEVTGKAGGPVLLQWRTSEDG